MFNLAQMKNRPMILIGGYVLYVIAKFTVYFHFPITDDVTSSKSPSYPYTNILQLNNKLNQLRFYTTDHVNNINNNQNNDDYYEKYQELVADMNRSLHDKIDSTDDVTVKPPEEDYYAMYKERFGVSESAETESTNQLTHTDNHGKARMVDVGEKPTTTRSATAIGRINVGPDVHDLISENQIKKGDVITVAKLAGIIGAKRTSELIPLCHNIPLSSVKVDAILDPPHHVAVKAVARTNGQTGVEMEALTAVSVALLTIYDMCKAVRKDMVIESVELIAKSGGKSGDYCKN